MRRMSLIATTLLSLPITLMAQSHPLNGDWSLVFVAEAPGQDGHGGHGSLTGTLSVVASGDSIVATIATKSADGHASSAPIRMLARLSANDATAVFVVREQRQLNLGGETRYATIVSTWNFRAIGDSLAGTVDRRVTGIEGVHIEPGEPQQITGARQRR